MFLDDVEGIVSCVDKAARYHSDKVKWLSSVLFCAILLYFALLCSLLFFSVLFNSILLWDM